MKNKFTLLVLTAEIVAIVVLHTARLHGKPGTDRASDNQSASSPYIIAAEKQPISYTSLK